MKNVTFCFIWNSLASWAQFHFVVNAKITSQEKNVMAFGLGCWWTLDCSGLILRSPLTRQMALGKLPTCSWLSFLICKIRDVVVSKDDPKQSQPPIHTGPSSIKTWSLHLTLESGWDQDPAEALGVPLWAWRLRKQAVSTFPLLYLNAMLWGSLSSCLDRPARMITRLLAHPTVSTELPASWGSPVGRGFSGLSLLMPCRAEGWSCRVYEIANCEQEMIALLSC